MFTMREEKIMKREILKFTSSVVLSTWLKTEAKKQKKHTATLIRELLNHVRLTNQRTVFIEIENLERQVKELRDKCS